MECEELKIIQVHPDLVREFNFLKEELEKRTGYPIKGGNPIISKIVAQILKRRRDEIKDNVKIEVKKIKGVKKNEVFFL